MRPRMARSGVGETTHMQDEPADPAAPVTPAAAEAASRAAADPDVALMLRVQRGDEAAFQELFQKFSPRVLQLARRLVRNNARAEEVTQDVFVQVFRFRSRYRPESRFATGLITTATTLCLREMRRPASRLRVDLWNSR